MLLMFWNWLWKVGVKGRRLSIRSLMVDKEKMRPGHWLGLVLCVPFSPLMLVASW